MSEVLDILNEALFDCLATARRSVLLYSPFIGWRPAAQLAEAAAGSAAAWELFTVLSPVNAAYGSLSLAGLRRLADAGVAIRHLPALHAKLFLIDDDVGFAGSANLTSAGLGLNSTPNLEISAMLMPEQCALATAVVARWAQAETVTPEMIDACEAAAKAIPVRFTKSHSPANEFADRSGVGSALLGEKRTGERLRERDARAPR